MVCFFGDHYVSVSTASTIQPGISYGWKPTILLGDYLYIYPSIPPLTSSLVPIPFRFALRFVSSLGLPSSMLGAAWSSPKNVLHVVWAKRGDTICLSLMTAAPNCETAAYGTATVVPNPSLFRAHFCSVLESVWITGSFAWVYKVTGAGRCCRYVENYLNESRGKHLKFIPSEHQVKCSENDWQEPHIRPESQESALIQYSKSGIASNNKKGHSHMESVSYKNIQIGVWSDYPVLALNMKICKSSCCVVIQNLQDSIIQV
jgi:hypothetical protein